MTDLILKQNIDKQQLSIFIRDLSSNLNVNLKHMIEDSIKNKGGGGGKGERKGKGKGKKVVIKKKDLIIQEQNKKRLENDSKDDLQKIDFLYENINFHKPFDPIQKLKTEKGTLYFKFRLLSDKRLNIKYKILLYFELKDTNKGLLNQEHKDTLEKIKDKLEDYEYKSFMMKELGNMLPPLNNTLKKLDDWQEEVIQYIHKKESVIVKAPTSAGKSFIAMATGIFHKKVLYVCPAKPVAFQVGAHFMHMGYKVHYFVENLSHNSYDSKTNIFIGTPLEIENNLYRLKERFDYAVFDEIHNLNSEKDGNIYENIIKLIDCSFLALSATIKNIQFLKDIFEKILKKRIHYVEYNKRFINHQKWVWKGNKMIKLHPLCAVKKVDDKIMNPLHFTPENLCSLWESIEENFDDDLIDGCSPDEYFKEDKLLTLDDCTKYEIFLKEKLLHLNQTNPNDVKDVLDEFKVNHDINDTNDSIISFIRSAKKMDMLPMLMFHTKEKVCKGMFYKIYEYLDKKELEEYPYHYEILEKKEELYEKYLIHRETFELKIVIGKTTDAMSAKNTKLESFDHKEKDLFIKNMIDFYNQKIKDIYRTDLDDTIKKKQEKNLVKEMNHFLENPDFNSQDIFQKHKDFIFTLGNPMSGDTIRGVRREIMKTLGIKIPYESPLFQMLKRGIGLYIETMPDEYNWILQKLLAKREIGIVISDKTLCLGIDLPIRTSCFLGIENVKFSRDEYLQMSGRAGRRGLDTQGNIIFYGKINYLELIDGELPEITGNTKKITTNYIILKALNPTIQILNVFENMINDKREIIETNKNNDKQLHKLSWYLREYEKGNDFLKQLFTLECDLYRIVNGHDKEILLINTINQFLNGERIIDIYKLKKINGFEDIYLLKEYIDILIHLYNHTNKEKYLIVRRVTKEVFNNLNHILFTACTA